MTWTYGVPAGNGEIAAVTWEKQLITFHKLPSFLSFCSCFTLLKIQ